MIYAEATGDGHDLPYGCIYYRKGARGKRPKYYIFWNPKGASLSLDPRVQQVCYESENILTGKIVQDFL